MSHLATSTGKLAAALLLSATLLASAGCGSQQAASSDGSASTGSASGQGSGSAPTAEQYQSALNPTNVVSSFIGEKFFDQKVTDEESALAAVKAVYNRIGADDTTELEIASIRPTETGTTYYIFNQLAGDVLVFGAGAKVIVDADGTATGLVSAILPKVEIARAETWEITAAQAEEAVVRESGEVGHAGVKPVEGATEQVLITVPNTLNHLYAWVVYTPNYDADSEMAYLAHYVDASGEYLYAIPIDEPHNADSQTGDKANFDFGKFEQDTWSGTVTLHDGTTKDIEVPVLVDKDNNASLLADGKRKILCADFAEWQYGETLSPRVSADASFDNVELLAYDTFIKVWDFYDSIGWTGPDDEGTPTLLLMDYVNANGAPEDNAMYMGRRNGFQTFSFNRLNPDGENMDVIAHEFTHCVTSTMMTTHVYRNETGAINEGMSDVLGNLIEMLVVDKPESAWLIGDSSGQGTLRSMKDPHEFDQPEFRWDTYYVPSVSTGTITNDQGGVHINNSLLNIVSYKLDQAGMPPADQFYFWLNVALAITPRTDFAQMAQLLPWCMEQSGYARYVDALKAAVDEAGYATLEEPATPPAGNGKVSIGYNAPDIIEQGIVRFRIEQPQTHTFMNAWPAAGTQRADCTVPADAYICYAYVGAADLDDCTMYVYTDDGWIKKPDGEYEATIIHVEEGKTLELPAQGLPETLDAIAN